MATLLANQPQWVVVATLGFEVFIPSGSVNSSSKRWTRFEGTLDVEAESMRFISISRTASPRGIGLYEIR